MKHRLTQKSLAKLADLLRVEVIELFRPPHTTRLVPGAPEIALVAALVRRYPPLVLLSRQRVIRAGRVQPPVDEGNSDRISKRSDVDSLLSQSCDASGGEMRWVLVTCEEGPRPSPRSSGWRER